MSKSAPSPASDCGTTTASGSLAAVNSSILSDTLSNIDFNDFLGLDSDTSSTSNSTPMVPWNMRTGTRNEGGNTLVTQTYTLANNSPRLNHLEWRGGRGTQPKRRRRNSSPDQGRVVKGKGKRAKGTAGIPMTRDFFLLIALCIGLACALVCLARPVIASIVYPA